jgi:hypothetical protein
MEASTALVQYGRRVMTHAEVSLGLGEARTVLEAIRETCSV